MIMKIILLGMEFSIGNRGCEALAYSFVNELCEISKEMNFNLDISTVVFFDKPEVYVPNTDNKINCIKIKYKDKNFWVKLKHEFDDSDIIFDFTMGDSFSDIYGMKRFVTATMIKELAVRSKTTYVLGPQTYGPYKSVIARKWAKHILKKSTYVFARDRLSKELAEKLSKCQVKQTIDVAFALPYTEGRNYKDSDDTVLVGFNPSGLLWTGGYTGDNQFNLKVDYQEYCWKLLEKLNNNNKYKVCLISHVGQEKTQNTDDVGYENDYDVCMIINRKFPEMKVLKSGDTPMDIKSDIAAMDVMIGARMHATIAAFSSGVATIPFSYSRKFEGLYNSIGYDYIIHATKENTDYAVEKSMDYIERWAELKDKVNVSMTMVNKEQAEFRNDLKKIIGELGDI